MEKPAVPKPESTQQLLAATPAPSLHFYITGRQPIRPAALLLAIAIAVGGISLMVYALGKTGHRRFATGDSEASRPSGGAAAGSSDNEKDDPNQVDTIVMGDAADAPVPARRGERGRPSEVHPTIIIRLPRYGDQVGLIPDTPAGHLLYQWLAAFNQTSSPALAHVLPNDFALATTAAAQMDLRQQTGGFNVLSAKEIQPGVLVFRLRDQTPLGNEVLGTLHVRPNSTPAAIASFSLRAIPMPQRAAGAPAVPASSLR